MKKTFLPLGLCKILSDTFGGGGALSTLVFKGCKRIKICYNSDIAHHYYLCRKFGFTLSEVLITLGIIGVVAALIMPDLIANYQKKVYVNKLKKQYSLWNNTFKTILVNEGVESLGDTTVFQAMSSGSNCQYNNSGCNDFYDKLSKYIKLSVKELEKDYESSNFSGTSGLNSYKAHRKVILTPDNGMLAGFNFFRTAGENRSCEYVHSVGGRLCKYRGNMLIDVNGLKGPNKYGRDIFVYYLSDDGYLYPYGGKDVAIYIQANHLIWNTYHSYCGLPAGDGDISGIGCAGRVMAEGWQMNY